MEEAQNLYWTEMRKEVASVLDDRMNYYNYGGCTALVENWERERCSLMLSMMCRHPTFPRECHYSTAMRWALRKRIEMLTRA